MTSLDFGPLVLGGNTFGWTSSAEESHAVLDAFAAGGGNFLDTADGYSSWVPGNTGGESETIIGEWMTARGNRDEIVVATKVSQHPDFAGLSAANVAAAADASLARLNTDRIDLYYAHFDDEGVPLEETVGAFNDLVVAGKVRAVGVSNYTAARVQEWFAIAQREGFALPVALQPHYNLVHREPFESELAPVVAAHGLGVMPYFSLASGFLTGKYRAPSDLEGSARAGGAGKYLDARGLAVIAQLETIAGERGISIATAALAWLRSRPGIVAPVASARTASQVGDLLAAASVDLTAEEVSLLDAASAV